MSPESTPSKHDEKAASGSPASAGADESAAPPTHIGRDSTREEVDQARYWDAIYEETNQAPGWDLGQANSNFAHALERAVPAIASGRALVLGCGFGADAMLLARMGFSVTAVDFSQHAIAEARKRQEAQGIDLEFLECDIFALPQGYTQAFDYVFEHTCFCAIHPSRREEYATLAHRMLKPQGQLIGIFYHHHLEGGPPWDATPEQVRKTFSPFFDVRVLTLATHSPERRAGKELFGRFWRK